MHNSRHPLELAPGHARHRDAPSLDTATSTVYTRSATTRPRTLLSPEHPQLVDHLGQGTAGTPRAAMALRP